MRDIFYDLLEFFQRNFWEVSPGRFVLNIIIVLVGILIINFIVAFAEGEFRTWAAPPREAPPRGARSEPTMTNYDPGFSKGSYKGTDEPDEPSADKTNGNYYG